MKIHEIFSKVSSESKQVEKKDILLGGDIELIKQIFNDTYDKSITYGVTSKNMDYGYTYGNSTIESDYYEFHNHLKALAERKITGNEAITSTFLLISQFVKEDAEWLIKILDRNLKIGVTLTQFNKWVGSDDVKFEVPLAYTLEKVKNVNPIDGTYYASHKLDGVRLFTKVDCDNMKVTFYSRSGKEYHTLSNLEVPILKIMEGKTGVWSLDGECCHINENGEEDFQAIMKEITRKNHTIEDPHYRLFDIVEWDVFEEKKVSPNFDVRYEMLKNLKKDEHIKVLEQELITSQEIFDKWAERVLKNNWEGFMLRKNAPFKKGRTKDLLKYKPYVEDFEVRVVDVVTGKQVYAVPGEGNKEFDVVSALVIHLDTGDEVLVGSGLSKEQRIEWFEDPSKIIGKMITIKYLEETVDKNGSKSLRHPTLKWAYTDGDRDV